MRNSLTAALAAVLLINVSIAAAQEEADEDRPMTERMQKKQEFMERMHQRMDADGDGAISKEEFVQAHEEMFARMDKDGDGKITRGEMESMRHHRTGRD